MIGSKEAEVSLDSTRQTKLIRFNNNNRNQNFNNYNKKLSSNKGRDYDCLKCGTRHSQGKCPAFGEILNFCKKPNHFETGCIKKKASRKKFFNNNNTKCKKLLYTLQEEQQNSSDDSEEFLLNSISLEIMNAELTNIKNKMNWLSTF
ncbi:hypothetical protein HHI36_007791 [Cryptolaemus montrouzieri]|uniref:Uncharacterized protein n=1 Tax=Cryptolaemus montrouzieri TaxID=559131 RepID=A0ABD2MQT0_9CUCU